MSETLNQAGDIQPARSAAKMPHGAIPFEAAASAQRPGEGFCIAWKAAPAAGPVEVFAVRSPDGSGERRLVGQGGASGELTLDALPPAPRWYFELAPAAGAPLIVAERNIALEGAVNFRDSGGYRTADGRWVRMGMIYRSDHLNSLTDGDVATLEALGLQLVGDLRTEQERLREPGRRPACAELHVFDVLGGDASDAASMAMDSLMAAVVEGRGGEALIQSNRRMVSSPGARAAYGGLFARLAGRPGAALYHCAAGKDRTGWASAVLLTTLGVPRETVLQDFMLSAANLEARNHNLLAHVLSDPAFAGVDAAKMAPLLTVRTDYIEAAFDEVEKRHGAFEGYLEEGLGLKPADVEALRGHYLAGAPA